MTMVPQAEIDAIRVEMERMLPETAVIYRPTRTNDTSGGTTEVLAASSPIDCRVAPLGGGLGAAMAEQIRAGRIGTEEAWMITFPAETDIVITDLIVILNDRPMEVVAVLAPRSWQMTHRVICVELH